MEQVKAVRERIELKYIISGLVSLFIFVILLSAAPSPWWFEKVERGNTTLEMTTWEFMTYVKTWGDDGVPENTCDYVDDDCYFMVNQRPAKSSEYHPVYSAVAAFTILAIVLAFSLGVGSIVFAFFSRRLPDTAKLVVNIVNSVLALVLSFFIIIGWVLLISKHKNMVQDATGVDADAAMCDLYKKIDIRLGGSACSFAARVLDSNTGDLVRAWGPMAGWILACCAFWICLLVYLPLTLLWVMITSADVNICPSKKGSRTKGSKGKKTIELDSLDRNTDSKEKRSKTTDSSSDDEGASKDTNGSVERNEQHEDDESSEDEKKEEKPAAKDDDVDSGDDRSESDSESESDD